MEMYFMQVLLYTVLVNVPSFAGACGDAISREKISVEVILVEN